MLVSGSALAMAGCAAQPADQVEESAEKPEEPVEEAKPEEADVDLKEFRKLAIDMDAWRYDDDNDVYYQLGIPYCLSPASEDYESLAIFVPGAYFAAKPKGRAYSCELDESGKVGMFTAKTAPVAMPINSGNLGGQACPTYYGYAGLDSYLAAGFVYVYAGFRGRTNGFESGSNGAYSGGDPWPLVDFKAAVRYLRYNASVLPGDAGRIFTFGFGLGGGMSALMGASGDSKLFLPYLEEIGAATHDEEGKDLSDATFGSASWCPITSFDSADAAYEWMMGQYFAEGPRADGVWTKLLSRDLAATYGTYVNETGLCDADGQVLTLDETSGEVFADGSYYNHLIEVLQDSAAAFFEHTTFPYTYTPQYVINAGFPGDPSLESFGAGGTDVDKVTGDASAQAAGVASGDAPQGEGVSQVESVVYATQNDYVNALNEDVWWLTLNESRATVRITSVGDFVRHLKRAVKDVCAFDMLDRSSVENQLFGVDDAGSLHFSNMVGDLLKKRQVDYVKEGGYDPKCVLEWHQDLDELDALGTTMAVRMGMFNPLYYLCESYEGAGSSSVAAHWRVNSGLFQTDTSLCTELNLALALQNYDGVADVEFTPVWGRGHELAEVVGKPDDNLISWIMSCCKKTN